MTERAGVNVQCRGCGRVWEYQGAQAGKVYTFACPDCATPTTFRVGRRGYRLIRLHSDRETKAA